MKQKLVDSLVHRLQQEIVPQSSLTYLLDEEFNWNEITDISISFVYLYTRVGKGQNKKIVPMAELITALGHAIRAKYSKKKDSALAARTGAFILYSFELLGIVKVVKVPHGKHATYSVEIVNEDYLGILWASIETENAIEKLPSEVPFEAWTSSFHPSGAKLVKTLNKEVLSKLNPIDYPYIFDCVNKAQSTGWQINKEIFSICNWALRNRTKAFADIWELHNPEAKASKIREAKAIISIASKFLDKEFYHLYYYDFRGRKYPSTAYLHEQGSDLARGLLLRRDRKRIGEQGFYWLLISIANSWAGDAERDNGTKTDKIPLNERVYWALDNKEILLSYANAPKINQGWMDADKPWQFLAACTEWKLIEDFINNGGKQEDWESSLEVFIDGSNNGSQHLAALTRDDITAIHVNLVPLDDPGDLYAYIAESTWDEINNRVNNIAKDSVLYNKIERLIDTIIDSKKQIAEAPLKSDRRQYLISKFQKLKEDNEFLLNLCAPVYWNRITDLKHRRKIVKRNVMTLPYGGTPYGLGQQQIDDARKHNIDILHFLEHKWASYLGRLIFEVCKSALKKPMQLLELFEDAGRKAEKDGNFLSWNVPITNFPVVQHYVEGKSKRVYVQYGPPTGEKTSTGYYENTLQLNICFTEDTVPSKGKQSQGAAPNIIHSLDAAHLMLVSYKVPFKITTIHDSFGSLLADMPELYIAIRETFVELHSSLILEDIMRQISGDSNSIEYGTLDINQITDSEYAFA